MKKVAISIGDLNGIGIELALENHHIISKLVKPLYMIDKAMLVQASKKLALEIPSDFKTIEKQGKLLKKVELMPMRLL